ncbi:hypothetical protein [Kitasatospora herbaricolor]|uniref:Uncharacterized protein n=1 Tax=Kitasatospora herbaricolor TaxID=68217 RepID=A0ABZ1WGG3_9ACTN|nr:hypothetical protein [Kitasatospora herbaricolor]
MTTPTTAAVQQEQNAEFTQAPMHEVLLRTAGAPGADFRVLAFYVTVVTLGQAVRTVAKLIAEKLKISEPTDFQLEDGSKPAVRGGGPLRFGRPLAESRPSRPHVLACSRPGKGLVTALSMPGVEV